jgi:hypothetical protein
MLWDEVTQDISDEKLGEIEDDIRQIHELLDG